MPHIKTTESWVVKVLAFLLANKEPLNTTETTIKFPAVRLKLLSFVEP